MNEYIEFLYDSNNEFIAKLHTDGKVRTVRDVDDINKLIDICYKYGYIVQGEGEIYERANRISKEFTTYMNKKHKVLFIIGTIAENMKLSKKNPTIKKLILPGALIGVIAFAHGAKTHDDPQPQPYTPDTSSSYSDTTMPYEEETVETTTTSYIQPSFEYQGQAAAYYDSQVYEDLESMFQDSNSFHFNFEDRSNGQEVENAKRYEDIFEKYARQYGVDKNLLIAMAAQESSGQHYEKLDCGAAEGIMQIEKKVHIDTTIYSYNFNLGKVESFDITRENIRDLDTNIKISAMILRNCLEYYNYNIPMGLQAYNMGCGSVEKVVERCSSSEGLTEDTIINTQTNNEWTKYRRIIDTGDPEYLEHVLSYLENGQNIEVLKRDGSMKTVKITNDYVKANRLT